MVGANKVANNPDEGNSFCWSGEDVANNASFLISSTDVWQGNKLSHIRRSPEDLVGANKVANNPD